MATICCAGNCPLPRRRKHSKRKIVQGSTGDAQACFPLRAFPPLPPCPHRRQAACPFCGRVMKRRLPIHSSNKIHSRWLHPKPGPRSSGKKAGGNVHATCPEKQKSPDKSGLSCLGMAEKEGFEPSIQLNIVYLLSRQAPSATRPFLQKNMAERVGFEPTAPFGVTGFQDQLLKPLGHLSILRVMNTPNYQNGQLLRNW